MKQTELRQKQMRWIPKLFSLVRHSFDEKKINIF